jgi:hypothetical protein
LELLPLPLGDERASSVPDLCQVRHTCEYARSLGLLNRRLESPM